jgi:hypothetical protein
MKKIYRFDVNQPEYSEIVKVILDSVPVSGEVTSVGDQFHFCSDDESEKLVFFVEHVDIGVVEEYNVWNVYQLGEDNAED